MTNLQVNMIRDELDKLEIAIENLVACRLIGDDDYDALLSPVKVISGILPAI